MPDGLFANMQNGAIKLPIEAFLVYDFKPLGSNSGLLYREDVVCRVYFYDLVLLCSIFPLANQIYVHS